MGRKPDPLRDTVTFSIANALNNANSPNEATENEINYKAPT